jgi:probable 2-oxoglutarate dehydrogenase E1 component DHKTD1
MLRNYRKPLIIVGPKALLRSPVCTSDLVDMQPGTSWQPVLQDPGSDYNTTTRVCFVSGKIYYDLVKARETSGKTGKVSFVRLEEFTPFPSADIKLELSKYKNVKGI